MHTDTIACTGYASVSTFSQQVTAPSRSEHVTQLSSGIQVYSCPSEDRFKAPYERDA